MGIGVSVFLIALGAILAFAVDFQVSGLDINTVGIILLIVGVLGLVTSFMFWDRMGFGGATSRRTVSRDTVVDGVVAAPAATAVRERTVVRDDRVV